MRYSLGMTPLVTKTLTIKDEVYYKLVAAKGKDESFSELFQRLVEHQSPSEILKSLRGKIELTKEEKQKILSEIDAGRERRV